MLRLVQDNARPGHLFDGREIAMQQGVAGDHQRVLVRLVDECRLLRAPGAVMNEHGKAGREALGFFAPVIHHRGGANEQHRARRRPLRGHAPAAPAPARFSPAPCRRPGTRPAPSGAGRRARNSRAAGTGAMCRAAHPAEAIRRRVSRRPSCAMMLPQRAGGYHAGDGQSAGSSARAQRHARQLPPAGLAMRIGQQLQRVPQIVLVEFHPLPAQFHQRRFHRRQRLQFGQRDFLVAHRHRPVELHHVVQRNAAAFGGGSSSTPLIFARAARRSFAPRRVHQAGSSTP